MSDGRPAAPPGYSRFTLRDAVIVARADVAGSVREALKDAGTLHGWAATQPGARAYHGRATAWGARLPLGGPEVVVRHARHGGLLAALTGDLFLWPGRAPWELEAANRLLAAGVGTPELVAYALHRAWGAFCRVDVCTRRLPEGDDFPGVWRDASAADRERMLAATAALLHALAKAQAFHADLNVKNVYLARESGGFRAYALDVDRVVFLEAGDAGAMTRNIGRLARSLRKARQQFGLDVPDESIATLRRLAGAA